MKQRHLLAAFLAVALCAQCFALTTYKPDFSSREGLATPDGGFRGAEKVMLDQLPDGTPCVKLVRGAMQPRIDLTKTIGDNEDYGFSLTYTRQSNESSACFGFKTDVEDYSALLFVNQQGRVLIHSGISYEATGLTVPAGVPTKIAVSVSRQAGRATVRVGDSAPYEGDVAVLSGLKCFVFSQQPPDGNISYVSDFEVHYGAAKVLTRQNIAPECTVVLDPNPTLANVTALLVDTGTDEEVSLPEKCTLTFTLPNTATLTAVQLFGGRPGVVRYPSGACSPKHFVIEGCAGGEWKQLAEVTDAPELCLNDALSPAEMFTLTEVEPTAVEQLRIRFIASHDTGNRMTGPLSDDSERSLHLREIQLFTDVTVAPPPSIRKAVKADWRLPFYRNAEKAELYMEVADDEQCPEAIHMKLFAPDGTTILRDEDIPVRAGVNRYMLEDIGSWEPGRYVTELSLPGSTVRVRRLLRLERVPDVEPAAEPMQMSAGKKLFFTPDDYLLSDCHNLQVKVFPADDCHLQARTPADPSKLICTGGQFFATQDGRYAIQVNDQPYNSKGKTTQRWLVSDSPAGPFQELAAGAQPPARKPANAIFRDYCKFSGASFTEGTPYEVYDPAVHGELDLSRIGFYYIYRPTDFGCLKTNGSAAFWLIGRTKDGKCVLPLDHAMMEGFHQYNDEALDTGFECNDNFGGFWLSEDGKTLYLSQGQTLRRCAPFAVPYDNFQLGIRTMTIYSTQDGIHWNYENTLVPMEEDSSFGAQHYGSMRMPLAQGDLVLAYVYAYDADYQQIYIELAYSRDNLHFHRFPGAPAFARGKDPSSWYYGHIFANMNVVQVGSKFFQQASYCTPLAHFTHEAYSRHGKLSEVTATDYENAFKRRTLAQRWPFFKSIGGYEGLAEYTRNAYYSNGVMEYRAYGWFGLEAGLGEGHFTTRRMLGGRRMTANVACSHGGYLEVEAVDAATGARLAIGRVESDGDGVAEPLFTLPEGTGEFFLRGRMVNAKLYTLDFAE